MKTFTVNDQVARKGISVHRGRTHHIIIGRSTDNYRLIPIKPDDVELIVDEKIQPCPEQGKKIHIKLCRKCDTPTSIADDFYLHPYEGEVSVGKFIFDVGIIRLNERMKEVMGVPLIITSPKEEKDNRALIHWTVESGDGGFAVIKHPNTTNVLAQKDVKDSTRVHLRTEILAVLLPGERMDARISGRNVENTHAQLIWTGKEVEVKFGDSSLPHAISDEDYFGSYV